jgi:serine/threonine protein kinase
VMLIPREGRRELVRRVVDESGLYELSEREKQFDFVKILDFGVAKVHDPDVAEGRVTQQGVVFGTPEYMAPETARIGTADPRTDVYALGVMFYEMLTGVVPFTGQTPVDVMLRLVSEAVVPPRKRAPGIEITDEAEHLIMKALSKDPRRRQQSMDELYHELQTCYGSVRYRRLRELPAQLDKEITRPGPIPLQKVKKLIPDPAAVGSTPPGTIPLRQTAPASAAAPTTRPAPPPAVPQAWPSPPILLTKRKDRKKTLPMGGVGGATPIPVPAPAPAESMRSYAQRPAPQSASADVDDIDIETDIIETDLPPPGHLVEGTEHETEQETEINLEAEDWPSLVGGGARQGRLKGR